MKRKKYAPLVRYYLPFTLLFVLGFSWHFNSVAQRIQAYNPITGDTFAWNADLPSFVQFRVENLQAPLPSANSANFPDWTYYWTFGDCKVPSLAQEPQHQYDLTPGVTYQVSLNLTGIYSDDDDLDALIYPPDGTHFAVVPSSDPLPVAPEFRIKPNLNAGIFPVRSPSPGQLVTYVIPYKNLQFVPVTCSVRIDYPSATLTPDLLLLDSCGYDTPPTISMGTTASLHFPLNQLLPEEKRFIHVNFWTSEFAETGHRFQLTVEYLDNSGLTTKDTIYATVVDSQDPNDKLVRESNVCPGTTLHYSVQFENFGNGPAQTVTVFDRLDTLLDMSTFTTGNLSVPNYPLSLLNNIPLDDSFNPNNVIPSSSPITTPQISLITDTSTHRIAWIFHNINLPPADSVGNEGFVSYTVQLRPEAPDNWTTFGQHASIYFDDNEKIPTRAAPVTIRPCYCIPTPPAPNNSYISSVDLNGVITNSGITEGYHFAEREGLKLFQYKVNTLEASFQMPENDSSTVYWQMWLDANRDGQFSENEKLTQKTGTEITYDFDPPPGIEPGKAILRIAAQTLRYSTACSLSAPGEIEDYQVLIEAGNRGDLDALAPDLNLPVLIPAQTNNFTGNYKNLGPSSILANTVHYYLSSDAYLSSGDLLLATHATPSMSPDKSITDPVTCYIPNQFSGLNYLLTLLDQGNSLLENQEQNNLSARQVLVSPMLPDLQVTSAFTCQPAIRQNTELKVSCRVTNVGPANIPVGSAAKLGVYVSAYPIWDSTAVFAANPNIPDLAVGSSTYMSVSLDFGNYPPIPTGNYYVHLRADENQIISEVQETNNTRTVAMELKGETYNQLPYAIGFECGGFDAGWNLDPLGNSSIEEEPLIALEGNHFCAIGSDTGQTGLGQADLFLQLDSAQGIILDFHWISVGSISKATDGIFLSIDRGNSFQKIYTFPNNLAQFANWHHFNMRLDSLALAQNLTLTDSVIVRWQFDDITLNNVDGFALDKLRVLPLQYSSSAKMNHTVEVPSASSVHVFPNPFRESTTISYQVPERGALISIVCYDPMGNEISQLLPQGFQEPGKHSFHFHNPGWTPGIYYCAVEIGELREIRKLVVMR